MSNDDLQFTLGRALADLGERIVRHIDDVRDHRHHEDDDRETVVEMGSLDGAPSVHFVPSEVWDEREYADGMEVFDEAYGGYVVREIRIKGGVPIVWGVWPDLLSREEVEEAARETYLDKDEDVEVCNGHNSEDYPCAVTSNADPLVQETGYCKHHQDQRDDESRTSAGEDNE